MARLLATQCPACKVSVRVDPDVEYHVCPQCRTRAFVRSPARVVPPEVQQQGVPVIVLSGGYTWTLPVALACATLGLGIAGVALLRNIDTQQWVSETSDVVRSNLDGARAAVALETAIPPQVNNVGSPPTPAGNAAGLGDAHEPESTHSDVAPQGGNTSRSLGAITTARDSIAPKPTSGKPAASDIAPASAMETAPASGRRGAGKVTAGQITVSGRLAPDTIRKVVGGANGRFRMCYERGLQKTPTLSGGISVRFVIGRDGSVSNASLRESDLPDADVKSCVVRSFHGLVFTPPESGIVTVVYPLRFRAT